jgi:hypothetical protein
MCPTPWNTSSQEILSSPYRTRSCGSDVPCALNERVVAMDVAYPAGGRAVCIFTLAPSCCTTAGVSTAAVQFLSVWPSYEYESSSLVKHVGSVLALQSTVVTMYTSCCYIGTLCTLPRECVCVPPTILPINIDYLCKQH